MKWRRPSTLVTPSYVSIGDRTMNAKSVGWIFATAAALHLLADVPFATEESLARRFANPPAEARILKIIHSWPDQPQAQDDLIRQLTRQGFGGAVCNVSFDDYLQSDAKWRSFHRAIGAAKKAGWALWLYDERGYPSGNAGGIVLREHPEWEASGLLIAETAAEKAAVTLALPPGRLFLAAAFPVREGQIEAGGRIDLAGNVRDQQLRWEPLPGRWHVMVVTVSRLYEGTHADSNLADKMPYINLLMPEPTRRFLEVTHQRYADRIGCDLGKNFIATFTDEPSLMSMFLRPMPYRVLPWAPQLPGEFLKRRGYALEPIVPDLIADAGPAGQKHRYDYWLTIAELVSENYFGQIQTWCRAHNVLSGGHLLAEESLVAHVPLYGDFLRSARRLDAPSMDCLSSLPPEVPWYVARLIASAAELEEKSVVMCETSDHVQRYRPPGDKRPIREVTEGEIRGTCNRLILGGVNCITSYYSFAGLPDEAVQRLNQWVGRCCTMLSGGHQVADIAVAYPVESLWTRYLPSRLWTQVAHSAARIETISRAAMDALFSAQRDFRIVDSKALIKARVENEKMVHGQSEWRIVVLPGADTLPLAAWENLARFVRGGGVVVALGTLPANSEVEFPSARVQKLAREIFGPPTSNHTSFETGSGGGGIFLPAGSEGLLPVVLKGVLEPDLMSIPPESPVRATHRRTDGQEVYFVINDSAKAWSGKIRVAAAGKAERWDPGTGHTLPASSTGTIPISLEPYGATLFRFAAPTKSRRLPLKAVAPPKLAAWKSTPR
jgi:hypothetical protein